LAIEIEAIWECSDRTYGAPRVHRWLLKQGFFVGRNRVARIMAINGWEGETGRRKVRTTIVDRGATAADDHVRRDFNPAGPDVVWCGDITYLRTGEGWLYLATVIDLFSRRVIGWSVANHMRTELVADALKMAIATRGGSVDAGVVFHTDRESGQYTSAEFGELCDHHGVVQSMGATGVCWDNAAAESFFGTLKREHANRRRWATRADARRDLIRWIEGWFNARRLHSSIDYNSPIDYEAMFNRRGDGIAA
jgi:transposase InsO family protein